MDFFATTEFALLDAGGRLTVKPPPILRRHFHTYSAEGSQRFDLVGRLFGGWWENLPSKERHLMRIDGEPVACLDWSSCHLRLCYLEAGEVPPSGDLYAIPGLEAHREGVKKAFSALISAERPLRRLPNDIKALLPPDWTAARITAALADLHPALKPFFGTGIGLRTQCTESNLLVAVTLRLLRDHRTPFAGLHDGGLVPRFAQEIAKAIMEKESERMLGVKLPVEEKPVNKDGDDGH